MTVPRWPIGATGTIRGTGTTRPPGADWSARTGGAATGRPVDTARKACVAGSGPWFGGTGCPCPVCDDGAAGFTLPIRASGSNSSAGTS